MPSRERTISIRVSAAELDEIVAASDLRAMPYTTWCRSVLLLEARSTQAEPSAVGAALLASFKGQAAE